MGAMEVPNESLLDLVIRYHTIPSNEPIESPFFILLLTMNMIAQECPKLHSLATIYPSVVTQKSRGTII